MTAIFLALAFIIILLAVVLVGQPNDFVVSRGTKITAPAGQVFPYINELRKWEAWSPWAKLDPNCQMTYDGPPAGVGSSYAWAGNNKVGAGRSTITQSVPDQLVRLKLEFLKPMTATNTAEFIFQSDGSETIVTWTMFGKNSFGGKVFGLLMNCEKMCASQFDKGLANMKSAVEANKTAVRA
jgi:hypothetical protein